MKTKIAAAFALIACSLSAQDWASQRLEKSPRHREWVIVKTRRPRGRNLRRLPRVQSQNSGRARHPRNIRTHRLGEDLADQLAEAGYIAIAPDLLSGMGAEGGRTPDFPPGGVGPAISHLDPAQITADLNAVADYALKLPRVKQETVCRWFLLGRSDRAFGLQPIVPI